MDICSHHGRSTGLNPANRFEVLRYEALPDEPSDEAPATQFLRDLSHSIISTNDSPDVSFEASINPYRGCEHGCIYCYARPTHEYLGFSSGLDFETRILVKEKAAELLRRELAAPRWQPKVLALSGVTDPYQPIERRLRITRGCLEVLAETRNPVHIITKSRLVTRDIDILLELARHGGAMVFISATSLDGALARILEPRAAQPAGRMAAIRELSGAGIPVGVMVAPVIPGLTDHEMPGILAAAREAGAEFAAYTLLRLPWAIKDLFAHWLQEHFPDRKDKVLGRMRELRGGKLNDSRFGVRMRGQGYFAGAIRDMFRLACKRLGMRDRGPDLSIAGFRRPGQTPEMLFE
jgi:DNA repair photolyase